MTKPLHSIHAVLASAGGLMAVVPVLAAAISVAAVVAAATLAAMPDSSSVGVEPLPVPILVDADPGLPSDSGPSGGVRQPDEPMLGDGAPPAGSTDDAPTPAPPDETVTDPVDEVIDDVTDPVDDVIDDVTDTVDDVIDDVVSELPELPALPAAPAVTEDTPAVDSFARLRDTITP